jgi:hypothetical protein
MLAHFTLLGWSSIDAWAQAVRTRSGEPRSRYSP